MAKQVLAAASEVLSGAMRSLFLVVLVAAVGMGAVAARALVIEYSHSIAKHAHTYAFIFNSLFNVIKFLVYEVVTEIVAAIDVIVGAINLFGAHVHYHPTAPQFKPVEISTAELELLFNDLPQRCEQYSDAFTVGKKAAKGWLHHRVCPTIRATWPVPWLWDLSNLVLGWASYDATPSSAWVTDGTPGNCEVPSQTDWFCAGLGAGFVLVEVVLPIIVLVVLFPLIRAVFKVIVLGVEVAEEAVDGPDDEPEQPRIKETALISML